jgi:hypothetical protein
VSILYSIPVQSTGTLNFGSAVARRGSYAWCHFRTFTARDCEGQKPSPLLLEDLEVIGRSVESHAELGCRRPSDGDQHGAEIIVDQRSVASTTLASKRFSSIGTYSVGGAAEIAVLSPHSTMAK